MGGMWSKIPHDLRPDVDRQPGAGRHRHSRACSASPASTPRTRSSRPPAAAHRRSATIAYWLGVVAAFMTAFYSWRLMFMTFHGKPRADHQTMRPRPRIARGHADPAVRAGRSARSSPAIVAYDCFVGEGWERLLGHVDRWSCRRARSCIDACTRCRPGSKLLPLIVGAASASRSAYLCYIVEPEHAGADRRARSAPLYRSCLQQVVLRRAL